MPKPNLDFKVEDVIIRKGFKHQNSQILTIDFIDYTRNVYIFKEPWVNSLSKFKSLDFDKAHDLFKLHQ